MYKISYLLIGILLIQSCQSDVVYDRYISLENSHWKSDQVLKFEIPMQDSIAPYNLFINLRNTKDYPYSNLFLITQMDFPDHTKVIDTLEYEMTNSQGEFLGSGFSDIKENKLFYKENVRFKTPGTYLFSIQQAMRERNKINPIDPLPGVSDVGISLEKAK